MSDDIPDQDVVEMVERSVKRRVSRRLKPIFKRVNDAIDSIKPAVEQATKRIVQMKDEIQVEYELEQWDGYVDLEDGEE